MVNQQLRSSRALRNGRRHIILRHPPSVGRCAAHLKVKRHTLALQNLCGEVCSSLRHTVYRQALHIFVFSADTRRRNCNGVTVVPVDRHLFKQWGANGCNAIAVGQRIQTHRGKDIPGAQFAIVVIAQIALPNFFAHKQAIQRIPDKLCSSPRTVCIEIHIRNVMRRLVGHMDLPLFRITAFPVFLMAGPGARIGCANRRVSFIQLITQSRSPILVSGHSVQIG